jgi:hypothetical protein
MRRVVPWPQNIGHGSWPEQAVMKKKEEKEKEEKDKPLF